jgi:haloalkane dehalogenase
MAYIDEKIGDGEETFLCLHGQPTWSYLYRKMIPVLLQYSTASQALSRRVVAPDLIGFGRSDKPTRDADYTFNFHRDALLNFIEQLNLTNVTLVVQDWGGILGLTLPLASPSRYKRLIVMNTDLSVGMKPTKALLDWKAFNNRTPDMKIGELMARSCRGLLSKAECNAYDAPFPNMEYKGGVRRFPNLLMISEDMEGVDISKRSMHMYRTSDHFRDVDVFMACGMKDPVLGSPVMKNLSKIWNNGCHYTEIDEGGHFLQEWGGKVARLAIQVFEKQRHVPGVVKVEPDRANL